MALADRGGDRQRSVDKQQMRFPVGTASAGDAFLSFRNCMGCDTGRTVRCETAACLRHSSRMLLHGPTKVSSAYRPVFSPSLCQRRVCSSPRTLRASMCGLRSAPARSSLERLRSSRPTQTWQPLRPRPGAPSGTRQPEGSPGVDSERRDLFLLGRDELEERRNALLGFRDAAADGGHDVLGIGDPFAVASHRTSEGGVVP